MKNTSRGFAWLIPLIILAVIAAAGVGTYVALKKPATAPELNTYNQTGLSTSTEQTVNGQNVVPGSVADNTTVNEPRIEFPWSSYSSSVTTRAASKSDKVIGLSVMMGGYSKANTVIGKTVNVGGGSTIGSLYAFDSLNFAADGKIDNLYVESSTSVNLGRSVVVGQKTVLSHNDLVRQAEAAAGAAAQPVASSSTSTTATTSTTVKVKPTIPTITAEVENFNGEWNGSFASGSQAGAACNASGAVSLSIDSSGGVLGYAIIKGYKVPGDGKVDSSGKLTGSWDYGDVSVSYTGKIDSASGTGSGTYQDNIGCFGTFSVKK